MSPRTHNNTERGFTLVELMVSMSLGMLVIILLFQIQSKMATSMRTVGQAQEAQQVLSAVQTALIAEIRKAGSMVPNGFRTAALGTPAATEPAIAVSNNPSGLGPDTIRFYYGDGNTRAAVTAMDPVASQWVDVDDASSFSDGQVVVLSNPVVIPPPGGAGTGPEIINYQSCIVEVTAVVGNRVSFVSRAPYNTANNPQCADVATSTAIDNETLMFPFIARSYRIDPSRLDLGVLQLSPSGELVPNDWVDLGINITTLQFATRFWETGDGADLDADGDPERDWYSADAQNVPDATATRPAAAIPIAVTASIEVRAPIQSGVGSATSGDFTSAVSIAHNNLGDWSAVSLPSAVPYDGNYVIRWATHRVDLRNIGVGE